MNIIWVIKIMFVFSCRASGPLPNCRDRSIHQRQDGGLCFEIPPWQYRPVELDQHYSRLYSLWGSDDFPKHLQRTSQILVNSDISRYLDTVLAPFLDTYHRNIQSSYQQFTAKILKRIKEEINVAILKKQQIYSDLTKLADDLNVPKMCDEERRASRTIASEHVAKVYGCLEEARASIAKMGRYAEDMILITRKHMDATIQAVANKGDLTNNTIEGETLSYLRKLSEVSVTLGYELDLSLTNARRFNEQSCENLSGCTGKVRRQTDDAVSLVRNNLYQCVFA